MIAPDDATQCDVCEASSEHGDVLICEGCNDCQDCCNCEETDCDCDACLDRRLFEQMDDGHAGI